MTWETTAYSTPGSSSAMCIPGHQLTMQHWTARQVLSGILHDVKQAWRSLALTDVAAAALAFAVLTPALAIVLRWFLRRSASDGVVADHEILFFLLTPLGVITLVVVLTIAGAIYFAQIAVTQVIALAAQHEIGIGPIGAFRIVTHRGPALALLALHALLRLLIVVAPALATAAGVYWLLLTDYDIYFYLTVKPREYWIAVLSIGAIALVAAMLVVYRLLQWTFAIPIVLFESTGSREALRQSTARVRPRLAAVTTWLVGWLAMSLTLNALSTIALGVTGRALIPTSGSLATVAAGVGVVTVISFLVDLGITVAANIFYAALTVRLYVVASAESVPESSIQILKRYTRSPFRLPARAACAVGIAVSIGITAVAVTAANRPRPDDAQITAHRGAKHDAPENTLSAIALAIEQGADWAEIDVQLTVDSQVIVVHDRDFNRVAGSSLRAETSSLAELQTLDVGAWFSPEFRGERPPTLDEVLDLVRGRIGLNIELKYFGPDRGLAERVIDLVDERDMGDQIVMMSFEHGRIAAAKTLRPDWTMGLLTAVTLGDVLSREADFYAVPTSVATRSFIRAAHGLDREVHVWTVDDPLRISSMVSRGADNIITGYAVVARQVLEERATLGAVERLLIDVATDLGVIRLSPPTPAGKEDA